MSRRPYLPVLGLLLAVVGCGDQAQTATIPPEMRAGSEGMKGHTMPAPTQATVARDPKGIPRPPSPWDPYDSHEGKDALGLPVLRYYTLPG